MGYKILRDVLTVDYSVEFDSIDSRPDLDTKRRDTGTHFVRFNSPRQIQLRVLTKNAVFQRTEVVLKIVDDDVTFVPYRTDKVELIFTQGSPTTLKAGNFYTMKFNLQSGVNFVEIAKSGSFLPEKVEELEVNITNIISVVNLNLGLTHKETLELLYINHSEVWTYIGDSPDWRVILPLSVDLISNGLLVWEVVLKNFSINESDIRIEARDGNVIDTLVSIQYLYGTEILITWNGDDTFSSSPAPDTGIITDKITDRLSDIISPTYYYYGHNRSDEWEILRNDRSSIPSDTSIELTANVDNNPTYTNLAAAWTDRTILNYI